MTYKRAVITVTHSLSSTGWAQINGRNAINWEERFDLDVWYVDNWNLGLDFKILCNTFIEVFGRRNITQENRSTVD